MLLSASRFADQNCVMGWADEREIVFTPFVRVRQPPSIAVYSLANNANWSFQLLFAIDLNREYRCRGGLVCSYGEPL